MRRIIKLTGIFIIFLMAYQLRNYKYDSLPRPGDSLDEYSYAWNGLGLIRLGVPVGWSNLETPVYRPILRYINVDRVYQTGQVFANPFYLHVPWMDHPPGLGLVTGGFAYLKGARVFEETGSLLIRKPLVILGSLNVVLLILLGWLYFDYRTGLLAGLIYAVSPFIVISSRLPQAENGYLPLFLLSLVLLKIFQIKKTLPWFFLSALVAGAGIWFKIPAVSISLVAALLLLPGIKRSLLFLFISLTFGFGPLLAYGLALDPRAFFNILIFNSQRLYGIGSAAFFNLFMQSKITGSISLTDGWIFLGWLSWFFVLVSGLDRVHKKILVIPVFTLVLMFLMLGSEFYGWYLFPLWPWLILSIAVLLRQLRDGRSYLLAGLGVLLPCVMLVSKFITPDRFSGYAFPWRIALPAYLLLITLAFSLPKVRRLESVVRVLIWVIFFTGIYLSIRYVYWLTPALWPSVS
jgi:hypothetical protein